MKRRRQFMKPEVWETILKEYVLPYRGLNDHFNTPTLILHKDGEPLIDKTLPDKLRAAPPDMNIDIYTHGLLLSWKFIDFLASLPHHVRLMISFHFFNHDGSTNDYTRTAKLLREVFSGGGQPGNVEFILSSHQTRLSAGLISEWAEGWRSFAEAGRCVVHANVNINPWTGLIDEPGVIQFGRCPYERFDHMFFGVTGNVLACCMDLEEELVFGNVMQDRAEDMVSSLRAFYKAQEMKVLRHDVCRNCFGLEPRKDLLQLGVLA